MDALAEDAADGNAFLLAGDGAFHLVDRPDPDLLARTVPADRPEACRTLDATVLHAALLDHVWRIPEDSPAHIAYIHDTAATVEQADHDGGTAVPMHPVRDEVVRARARPGVPLPPHSASGGPPRAWCCAPWTSEGGRGQGARGKGQGRGRREHGRGRAADGPAPFFPSCSSRSSRAHPVTSLTAVSAGQGRVWGPWASGA